MLANLSKSQFMAILGGIYEKTPWVAEQYWQSFVHNQEKWDNFAETNAEMQKIVKNSDASLRLKILQSHPELVGKLALAGKLTAESTREQAGAGLNQCSPDEFQEFQTLNSQYNEKFGFPFIVAVSGKSRLEILQIFKSRVNNDYDAEFQEAMAQVYKIAEIRLKQVFENPETQTNKG